MKTLFLTSSFLGTSEKFVKEIEPKLKRKCVTFVDTASKVEEYTKYVDDARKWFLENDYNLTELDFSVEKREKIVKKLEATDLLYISGGNSFFLLQEIEKKDLKEVIREKISRGMIYVGESAGAIISAQDIEYSALMDDRSKAQNLKTTAALGLISKYIVPHFGEIPFVESAQAIVDKYTDLDLLLMDNHTAVLYQDDEINILE